MNSRRLGFTIVEVIVVIVVIGILAAVGVVAYGNWRSSLTENQQKNDLQGLSAAMESERSSTGAYPSTTPGSFVSSEGITVTVRSDGNIYCAEAYSEVSGARYRVMPSKDIVQGGCELAYSDLSAGASHTCGIAYGKAYCWGSNSQGHLGNGTTSASNVPVAVDTSLMVGKVVDIDAGSGLTCAVADEKVYCWGSNSSGALGNGSAVTTSAVPVQVSLPASEKFNHITVGQYFACAATNSSVYCWGANSMGQLGDGTQNNSNIPVRVISSTMQGRVTSISAGSSHMCAIASFRVYCWGTNLNNQLGLTGGAAGRSSEPVLVPDGVFVNRKATVVEVSSDHSCAITDGTAYCWGRNVDAKLGDGSTVIENRASATQVNPFYFSQGKATEITAEMWHTCGIAEGRAFCWGRATAAGSDQTGILTAPTPVATDTMKPPVKKITAGQEHTCALSDWVAYCWGSGSSGKLGNGSTTSRGTPDKVSQPAS